MDMEKFSALNRTRCESPSGFKHKLNDWSLSDWFTAFVGEVGESANIIKKLNRYRDGIPGNLESFSELRDKLAEELADAYIYLDLLAQAARIHLPSAVQQAFNKKSIQLGYGEYLFREGFPVGFREASDMDRLNLKPGDGVLVISDAGYVVDKCLLVIETPFIMGGGTWAVKLWNGSADLCTPLMRIVGVVDRSV